MNYAKTFIGYEKDFERKGDLKKKESFSKLDTTVCLLKQGHQSEMLMIAVKLK